LGVLILALGVLAYWLLSRPPSEWAKPGFSREPPPAKKAKAGYVEGERRFPRDSAYYRHQNKKFFHQYKPWPGKQNSDSLSTLALRREPKKRMSASRAPISLQLNQADSAAWEQLPGIGPVLASRIIRYRQKLGGFHCREQLKEVFGLADTVYEKIASKIVVDAEDLKKISLNSATAEELKSHPYLRWEGAKAIVRYREANGPFKNLDQLKNIWNLPAETLEKILPYLIIEKDSSTLVQ
jgi:competence ComEA-like helix-hairpin-helix protein